MVPFFLNVYPSGMYAARWNYSVLLNFDDDIGLERSAIAHGRPRTDGRHGRTVRKLGGLRSTHRVLFTKHC